MEVTLILIVAMFFIYILIDEILHLALLFSFLAFIILLLHSNIFMATIFLGLTLFIFFGLSSYEYQSSSNHQRQQMVRKRQARNTLFSLFFIPILIIGFIALGYNGML